MLKLILSAAVASLMICSMAYAGTAPARPHHGTSDVVQIKKGDDDNRGKRSGWDDDVWRDRGAYYGPDRRYRNWHRYAYRPDDWDDRGCIAVGPLWYCP
jgi:hypothetical protein